MYRYPQGFEPGLLLCYRHVLTMLNQCICHLLHMDSDALGT